MMVVTFFNDSSFNEMKLKLDKVEELKSEVSEVAIRSISLQNKLDDEIVKNENLRRRLEEVEDAIKLWGPTLITDLKESGTALKAEDEKGDSDPRVLIDRKWVKFEEVS